MSTNWSKNQWKSKYTYNLNENQADVTEDAKRIRLLRIDFAKLLTSFETET